MAESLLGSRFSPPQPRQAGLLSAKSGIEQAGPKTPHKDCEQQRAEESPFLCLWAQMLAARTAKDAAIYSGQKLKGARETQGRVFFFICSV